MGPPDTQTALKMTRHAKTHATSLWFMRKTFTISTLHDYKVEHNCVLKCRGCHPYLRNVSAFSVNFHLNRWRYSHVTSFLANHAAMFLGPWARASECCSSNSNAPDISQKGLIGIQSHHSMEKMSKKARKKPAGAGSASVSPYGSVLGYELVTSQPNRLINLIWPECRTWVYRALLKCNWCQPIFSLYSCYSPI